MCSNMTEWSAGVGTVSPCACQTLEGHTQACPKGRAGLLSAAFHNLSIKTTCEAVPQPSLLTLGPLDRHTLSSHCEISCFPTVALVDGKDSKTWKP